MYAAVALLVLLLLTAGCYCFDPAIGPPEPPATTNATAPAPPVSQPAPPTIAETAPTPSTPARPEIPADAATPRQTSTPPEAVPTRVRPPPPAKPDKPAPTVHPATGPAAPAKPLTLPAAAATPPASPTTSTERTPSPPGSTSPASTRTLDLNALTEALKSTPAIGFFTKIALKNQVDDLLDEFRAYHARQSRLTANDLRQSFELLVLKVLSLLQDKDPRLASEIASSREVLWELLVDPKKFAALQT